VRGMFVGRWSGMRIDVFLPSIDFAFEAERTRVRVTDDTGRSGWSSWIWSAWSPCAPSWTQATCAEPSSA